MKIQPKKYIITLLLWGSFTISYAQINISGNVTSEKTGLPIPAATIRLKGSGTGVTSDSTGQFSLTAAGKGKQVLQVSCVGFATKELTLLMADSAIHLDITLKEDAKTLGEVVVVGAGSFEASDKAKGASLTPIDAVTVAGTGGDIANALRWLPGVQQIGEREGLFVRGGTGEESKQFVDGTFLKNPNFSSVPGMPQYARLNPFLFRGILFSSGGYSALYGEALSGALILETVNLPDKSSASMHLFPQSIGAGMQQLAKNGKSSFGINTSYGNQHLYNQVVPQHPDFYYGPEYGNVDANYRVKTSATGMLKVYANYGYSHTGMRTPDVDSTSLLSAYEIKGRNAYANISYRESLPQRWTIDVAAAYNFYKEDQNNGLQNGAQQKIDLSWYPYNEKNRTVTTQSHFAQARTVFSKGLGRNQTLRFGSEYFFTRDHYIYNDSNALLTDGLAAVFAEGDIRLAANIAARVGVRAEHSTALQRWALAPRLSVAYKLPHGAQINMAWGVFYQEPEGRYLVQQSNALFTRATHYIINYQKKAGNRLFRIEGYYKTYAHLTTTVPGVANNGDGYARGIELFWRDKKTIRDFDYWISYTYLDTKRKFLDYPYALRPNFTTPHTLSVACKKFFPDLNFSANLSYALATGRPYYDIQSNNPGETVIRDQGSTPVYQGVNLSFAKLFSMFPKWKYKDFSGIGFGVNNVTGAKQVFGYNYSYDGRNKTPIVLTASRSYYIGLFMTLGIDRRDDFINENL